MFSVSSTIDQADPLIYPVAISTIDQADPLIYPVAISTIDQADPLIYPVAISTIDQADPLIYPVAISTIDQADPLIYPVAISRLKGTMCRRRENPRNKTFLFRATVYCHRTSTVSGISSRIRGVPTQRNTTCELAFIKKTRIQPISMQFA